ncbi:sialate O-acetylesterase [Lutibacter citreus]|uniref:sialate O-acetylesterase n=1 Tax=Lutibacter citreus TaxID=2138210 RepID=UPI000DBE9E08|nr:sialate O-acetylesterase [Lutibacter citreus]
MRQKLFIILILNLFSFAAISQQVEQDTFRLFFLGGQSNMDGYGYNSDLPKSLKSDFKNVWIFHGNPADDEDKNGGQGLWEALKPGHGKGFTSDDVQNKLSNRFGPELSFAMKMKKLYPNEKIAIIKYSKSGSSIDSLAARKYGSWEPEYEGHNGINQYDHFLKTVSNALEVNDIDNNGKIDKLIPSGILWMQGESDALDEHVASRYYDNLKRLMDLIRAALRVDDLPIALGKISDSGNNEEGKVWKYGELVQHGQEKFSSDDKNTFIVRSTRNYKYSDKHHYDSNGYIDLGEKFAEAIYQLSKNN